MQEKDNLHDELIEKISKFHKNGTISTSRGNKSEYLQSHDLSYSSPKSKPSKGFFGSFFSSITGKKEKKFPVRVLDGI